MPTLGTENLKKLIDFSLGLAEKLAEDLKDKKISIAELVGFLPELIQIPGIVKSFPDIAAEFKDLDATERQELVDYFAEKFDIPDDKIEAFVENALSQAVSLISLVQQFKDLNNKP
jgi:hypothetical protein